MNGDVGGEADLSGSEVGFYVTKAFETLRISPVDFLAETAFVTKATLVPFTCFRQSIAV